MAFIEERLLNRIAYGFTGGPSFLTTKVSLLSGRVARNAERSQPLYVFNAPYGAIQQEHFDLVVSSFNACLGGLHSFRFRDKTDHTGTTETIGTSTGGADQELQLIKTYTFGGQSTVRTIKKPVAGTVSIFEDGTPLASTVDTTTGIVTFTGNLTSPLGVITATYEFDVPVMFMDDDLQFSIVELNAMSAEINLREDLSA